MWAIQSRITSKLMHASLKHLILAKNENGKDFSFDQIRFDIQKKMNIFT